MTSNPYASPQSPPSQDTTPRHWTLLGLLPTGVLAGALLGGLTNVVNGLVCPQYFAIVMGWSGSGSIWLRSILQGLLEGAITGGVFAIALTTVIVITTGMQCSYRCAVRYVALACGAVLASWFLGGVIGLMWATIDPASYRSAFPIAPKLGVQSFAWVGGSIWGGQFGGLPAVLLVAGLFVVRWKRLRRP